MRLSVALNIAEGSGRGTKKDFARFVRIGRASLLEVDAALTVAQELHPEIRENVEALHEPIKKLYFQMIGFEKYLLGKNGKIKNKRSGKTNNTVQQAKR